MSESEISALLTGTRSVIRISFVSFSSNGGTARPISPPIADDFARDHQLSRRIGWPRPSIIRLSSIAQLRAAAAEVPRRRAGRAEDRAHAVGGDGRLDAGRQMEADGIRRRVTDLTAALRHHLVGAAQFLAVIAEHQAALMDQAEAADVAVVARFQPAAVIVLAALDGDVLDALAERAVGQDRGRIGVAK